MSAEIAVLNQGMLAPAPLLPAPETGALAPSAEVFAYVEKEVRRVSRVLAGLTPGCAAHHRILGKLLALQDIHNQMSELGMKEAIARGL